MRGQVQFTLPELALVLGTRAALGVGLGLLLAGRFASAERRAAVGRTLLLSGAFTAACLGSQLFVRPRPFTLTFGAGSDTTGGGSEPRQRPMGRQQAAMPTR